MTSSDNLLPKLEPLIGSWRSSGSVLDDWARQSVTISGTDEYEWMPGQAWLIHRVDVLMGVQHTRSLELFGD